MSDIPQSVDVDNNSLVEETVAAQSHVMLLYGRRTSIGNDVIYADPGNGGNAGGVSWGLVGYDPRPKQA